MYTRKEMTDRIAVNVGDEGANAKTKIREFIDRVVIVMAQEIQFPGKMELGHIKTTSGQFMYGMEPDVAQIVPPITIRGKRNRIYPRSLHQFRQMIPDPDNTGDPDFYVPMGAAGVKEQPASVLRAVSDSASDTGVLTVPSIVRGLQTDVEITLTGTTAVLSTKEVTEVTALPTSDTAAVGTITLTANSTIAAPTYPTVANAGHVQLCQITAGNTQPTSVVSPASVVRIKMLVDAAGDRNQQVTVAGVGVEYNGSSFSHDRVPRRITVNTDASDSTTEVRIPSTDNDFRFTTIDEVSKNWDSTETMLVTVDPQNDVAVIPPNRRSMQYQHYGFFPFPDGTNLDFAYYQRVPAGLENDSDIPPFDDRAHYLVEQWAEILMKDYIGSQKGASLIFTTREWKDDMQRLRSELHDVDYIDAAYGEDVDRVYLEKFGELPSSFPETYP